ncbi:MAG: phosphatidylglycerol lysyltransferase domain-containing protein, partial [Xanthobacteraceae bacterium]
MRPASEAVLYLAPDLEERARILRLVRSELAGDGPLVHFPGRPARLARRVHFIGIDKRHCRRRGPQVLGRRQFEFDAQASRSLRAILGASILALGVSLWQLLRTAPGRVEPPSAQDLSRAASIIHDQERSAAMLALMGDKSFLFSSSGNSFLMYAKRGRSWVGLFDPVGRCEEWPELVWRFVELADRHGGRAAFYQVRPDSLPLYLDAGLRVVKVGEEACIYLDRFSLEGSERYGLRQALKRGEREGLTFQILPPQRVCQQQDVLNEISERWLSHHRSTERRFSV